MAEGITIGQLAGRLGVNPRTIRYYERIRLLPEPRRGLNGYRRYDGDTERRVRFIKAAQRTGLTLGEIKEVLAFRDRGERPCTYVAVVVERHLGDIDQRIGELRALKAELTELHRRISVEGGDYARVLDDGYCHYIERSG